MTDNEFMAAYRIVSIRGRVYSRDMLLNAATRTPVARVCKVSRRDIRAVLDDPKFMRPLARSHEALEWTRRARTAKARATRHANHLARLAAKNPPQVTGPVPSPDLPSEG